MLPIIDNPAMLKLELENYILRRLSEVDIKKVDRNRRTTLTHREADPVKEAKRMLEEYNEKIGMGYPSDLILSSLLEALNGKTGREDEVFEVLKKFTEHEEKEYAHWRNGTPEFAKKWAQSFKELKSRIGK